MLRSAEAALLDSSAQRGSEHVYSEAVPATAESEQKAAFLSQYGHPLGYDLRQESLQQMDFSRLGSRVFVDHAGSTLYAASQLQHVFQASSERLMLSLEHPC